MPPLFMLPFTWPLAASDEASASFICIRSIARFARSRAVGDNRRPGCLRDGGRRCEHSARRRICGCGPWPRERSGQQNSISLILSSLNDSFQCAPGRLCQNRSLSTPGSSNPRADHRRCCHRSIDPI
jgi:hypothetical protein